MDNTLSAAELKRRGMAAIEEGLQRGPDHVLLTGAAAFARVQGLAVKLLR